MDQPPTSPRQRSRGFSFRSDKSGSSKGKVDLTESPQDKARRDSIWKNNSKANPNAALSEAQPGALNLLEQSTLQSLRESQHKDTNGNVIADPDLSNPTRPRLERPLDTIRSFERAIDDGYRRRSSVTRSESHDQSNQYTSRRSSYYGGGYDPNGRPAPPMNGGYYGHGYGGGPSGPQRARYGRMQSDGNIGYGPRPLPQHGHNQSLDTMNTGVTNGSDSTGPWANSTDPSSENSSIENNGTGLGAGKQPVYAAGATGYGATGYGSPPIMEEQGPAPPVGGPVQEPTGRGRPIPLGNSGGGAPMEPAPPGKLPSASRPEPEKRKSWLKRRFSKD